MQLGGVSSRGRLSEISNHLQQLLHTGRSGRREGGREGWREREWEREWERGGGGRGMGRGWWHYGADQSSRVK